MPLSASAHAAEYRLTVTELVLTLRRQGFFLGAHEESVIEGWRSQAVPLDSLCRAIVNAAARARQALGEQSTLPSLSYLEPVVQELLVAEGVLKLSGQGRERKSGELPTTASVCASASEDSAALSSALATLGAVIEGSLPPAGCTEVWTEARREVEALQLRAEQGAVGPAEVVHHLQMLEISVARVAWRYMDEQARAALQQILGAAGTPSVGQKRRASVMGKRAAKFVFELFGLPRFEL